MKSINISHYTISIKLSEMFIQHLETSKTLIENKRDNHKYGFYTQIVIYGSFVYHCM